MSLIKRDVPKRGELSLPSPVMFQKLDVRNTLVNLRRKSFPPFDYKTFPLEGGEGYGDLMVMVDASGSMEPEQFELACQLGYSLGKRVFAGSADIGHVAFYYQEITPDTDHIYTGAQNVDYGLDDICSLLSINHILYVTDGKIVGSKMAGGVRMRAYPRKVTYIIDSTIGEDKDKKLYYPRSGYVATHTHWDDTDTRYIFPSVIVPQTDGELMREMLGYLIKTRPWTEGGIQIVFKNERWTHKRVPESILKNSSLALGYSAYKISYHSPTSDCDSRCTGDHYKAQWEVVLEEMEVI
jgi:hypothetical protein